MPYLYLLDLLDCRCQDDLGIILNLSSLFFRTITLSIIQILPEKVRHSKNDWKRAGPRQRIAAPALVPGFGGSLISIEFPAIPHNTSEALNQILLDIDVKLR